MKHLKKFEDLIYKPDRKSNDDFNFYVEAIKAANFFDIFVDSKISISFRIPNHTDEEPYFSLVTNVTLGENDVQIYFNEQSLVLDFSIITKLADILKFLNRGAKQLADKPEWKIAENKIWQYAIEKDPSNIIDCPKEIVQEILPKLDGLKNLGII